MLLWLFALTKIIKHKIYLIVTSIQCSDIFTLYYKHGQCTNSNEHLSCFVLYILTDNVSTLLSISKNVVRKNTIYNYIFLCHLPKNVCIRNLCITVKTHQYNRLYLPFVNNNNTDKTNKIKHVIYINISCICLWS